MRGSLLVGMTALAGCNQVFDLGPVEAPARSARFERRFLGASSSEVVPRTVTRARYLVEEGGALRALATSVVDNRVFTDVDPGGPYLLEVEFADGDAPVIFALAAPSLHHVASTHQRIDREPVIGVPSLRFQLALSTPWIDGDRLTFQTFGTWARAEGVGAGLPDGATSIDLTVPWAEDQLLQPERGNFGRLTPDDVVTLVHLQGSAAEAASVGLQATSVDQRGDVVLTGAMQPTVVRAVATEAPAIPADRRVALVPGFGSAEVNASYEVRSLPWQTAGSIVGLLGARGAIDPMLSTISYGVPASGFPGWDPVLLVIVGADRTGHGALLQLRGVELIPIGDGATPLLLDVTPPFMEGFTVNGVDLNDDDVVAVGRGAIELSWKLGAGAADSLYNVELRELTPGLEPVTRLRVSTANRRILVPTDALPSGSYSMVVTAATGYPGFVDGDLSYSRPARGTATSPSPAFMITP